MTALYNLLFLLAFVNIYAAHEFRIRVERCLIAQQDPEYFIAKAWATKVNRTSYAVNLYMNTLKPIPPNTVVVMQCYEFLNNEYRPFAINVRRTVCHYLENEYKLFIYRSSTNLMPPKCPYEAGNYSMTNYTVDTNRLPSNLPFNKMMFEIKYILGKVTLITVQFYLTFDRDIIIREQFS